MNNLEEAIQMVMQRLEECSLTPQEAAIMELLRRYEIPVDAISLDDLLNVRARLMAIRKYYAGTIDYVDLLWLMNELPSVPQQEVEFI